MSLFQPLGELLLERALITPEQLAYALQDQAARRSRGEPSEKTQLGNILCGLAFLTTALLALGDHLLHERIVWGEG